MLRYAMFSLGRDGAWEESETFVEAKQVAEDYYRAAGWDAEETVILMFDNTTLLKAWEKNSNSKWVRIRDDKYLAQLQKEVSKG